MSAPKKRRNPVRPKVKAAGQASGTAAVLVWMAGLAGVDTASVPPPVWVLAAGAIATVAAYIRQDGLLRAWDRLVNGPPRESRGAVD